MQRETRVAIWSEIPSKAKGNQFMPHVTHVYRNKRNYRMSPAEPSRWVKDLIMSADMVRIGSRSRSTRLGQDPQGSGKIYGVRSGSTYARGRSTEVRSRSSGSDKLLWWMVLTIERAREQRETVREARGRGGIAVGFVIVQCFEFCVENLLSDSKW